MSLERSFYGSPEKSLYARNPERELLPAEERLASYLYRETRGFPLPSFEEFDEVYTPEEIAKDKKKLKEVVRGFESYSGERSDLVTRLFLHLVYDLEYLKPKSGNWEVYAGLTHPYDDKLRGADMVIVFYNRKSGEELPLAVDTTTGSDTYDKEVKIRRDFEHGNLRRLKYYKSPVNGQAVGQKEMPAVILGYTPENFQKIAKAWQKEGNSAFEALLAGLEKEIRAQLLSQVADIKELAPAHRQTELIDKIGKISGLFSGHKEKGATEVAPIQVSRERFA